MSHILLLDESTDVNLVGNLGAHLSLLARDGLRVADGFILPTGFSLEDGMSNEIMRSFDRLKAPAAILRTSFPKNSPDNNDETLRDVGRRELIDAVKYMRKNASRRGLRPALVIQKDLQAEVSGTVHSINPATRNRREVLIEANLWMNRTVLGGFSEPDMILIDKNTGATTLESDDENEICLSPEQIHQLFVVVRRAEKRLGFPLSLDWAYDNGVLYILRGRRLDEGRLREYENEDR